MTLQRSWRWHQNALLSRPNGGANMNRIGIVLVVVAGLVAAGLIALSAWQIPAPTAVVNKVVPDENLPK